MNEREKGKLHALHYFHKRKRSTLEHQKRVLERQNRKEERARQKKNRERRTRALQEYIRELQEKQRFLSGSEFFTYPGAALLFDTEAEARKSGGDQVRRFDTVADAVRYAKGEQDAERRREQNTEKRTD